MKSFYFLVFVSVLLFSSSAEATNYRYIKEAKPIPAKDISSSIFPEKLSSINNGLDNGVYWIYFPADSFSQPKVIVIPSARIDQVSAYQNGNAVSLMPGQRYVTLEVKQKADLYIRVNCIKEAYIPLKMMNSFDYTKAEQRSLMLIGMYFGLVGVVAIYNMLYFFTFKENTFLYYLLFLLSISASMFYSDGMLTFLNSSDWSTDHFEIILHPLVAIFGAMFASSFLQLNLDMPKAKNVTYVLVFLLLTSALAFVRTEHFTYFVFVEMLTLLSLSYYWVLGLVQFQKSEYAKILVVAYFLVLVMAIDFYTTHLFGFQIFSVSPNDLKIGGILEVTVLSCSVIYRMNRLSKENIRIKDELRSYLQQVESLSEDLFKNKDGQPGVLSELQLSAREDEILRHISMGKTNKEIAEELFISVNTVKFHTKKIYEKLNISSRKEARLIGLDQK